MHESKRVTFPAFTTVFFWACGCAIALAMGLTPDGRWRIPLFLGGSVGLFWIWRRFSWPDGWSRYLSFGAAVLLAAGLNRLLYVADLIVGGGDYSQWPFYTTSPEYSIFKGEVVTLLGTLVTVGTWVASGGAQLSPEIILQAPKMTSRRVFTAVYSFSLLGLALQRLVPDAVTALGQMLFTLSGAGIATSFFLPIVTMKSGFGRVGLSAALCAPFVYFALGNGMKEDIIVAMVPVAYMAWTASRSAPARLAVIAASAVVVGLTTVYVTQYREDVWQAGGQVTIRRAVSQFAETTDAHGGLETITDGVVAFLDRSNASAQRGWAVSLADEYGHEPGLVFAPMAYVFVPRALWPNKPEIKQGWEYSGLLFGDAYISWSGSSTATGLYPGFYLGFGWTGVVGGAACIGLMMGYLLKLAWRTGGPLFVSLYGVSMIPYSLRLDENWSVGALSAPVISFAYLLVILFISKAMSTTLAGPRPLMTGSAPSQGLRSIPFSR